MAGLEEGVSPLNPPNRAASPKSSFPGSRENNDNYSGQYQMISNFQNHGKIGEKHFMSPTISAASKVAPRKNILVERDENLSSSHSKHHKISNIDHKRNSRNQNASYSRNVLSCSQTSESDDDGETNLYGSSRLKPYNSLTNYLSPRPKYLRFNPNRRREILNRLEKEAKEELNCTVHDEEDDASSGEGIKDSSSSPVTETVMNQQNGGNAAIMHSDSEEEEEVEFEEKRGWCLKGVFKILITLIACFLSTYICSMNSSSPLPLEQAIWDAKGGYFMIQNETLEIISKKMWDTGFFSVEERRSYLCSHEVEIIENDNGERPELDEVEIEEYDNGERKEHVGEKTVEDDEVDSNALEEEISGNDVDIDVKIDKAAEIVDVEGGFGVESEKFVQLEDAKAAESSDDDAYGTRHEVAAEKEAVEGEEVETETYITQEVNTNINECEEVEDSDHEVDMKLNEDDKGTLEKAERSILFGIGLSVVSISLALLALFYHLEKNVRSTSGENYCPVLDVPKFDVDDKLTSFAVEKKIEISIPPLQTLLMEEVPKDLNQNIYVPTVELIGEIVVGGSSSFRSCKKNKIVGSEESSDSLFHDQCSLKAPTQPLPMEFYTPTFGRKSLKKEGGKNGKATIEVTPTPVRRSTRLRKSAALVSP